MSKSLQTPAFPGLRPADLRHARSQLEWSQAELARRLGVSRKAVNHWEHGGTIPLDRQIELRRLFKRTAAAPGLSGSELRALRMERAWGQRELARRLRVSQVIVAKWEREQLPIPADRRQQLRRLFARRGTGARNLHAELLALLEREPGLPQWRVRAALRCDQRRLRDVVERAIIDELVHRRVVVVEDMPRRLRRTQGLFPGRTPALVEPPPPPPTLTREQLRARRLTSGLSHEALAREVGVSRRLLGRWEDGSTPIPPLRLQALVDALERPREQLDPISAAELLATRERLGWTRAQLARQLGVGAGAIYDWEHGKRAVPQRRLAQLRAVFALPTPPPAPALAGDELRRARQAAHLSQSQLAELVGLTQTTISGWELEHQEIPEHRRQPLLAAIAAAPLPVRAPTAVELRAELARVGMSGSGLARRLGARKGTVYRWLHGEEISSRYRVAITQLLHAMPTAAPVPAAPSGTTILEARKRLGWSQRELAAAVGVWQGEVSAWERSRNPVSPDHRARLLQVLTEAKPKAPREPHAERCEAVRRLVEREPGISGRRVFGASIGGWADVRAAIRTLVEQHEIHERLTQPAHARAYTGLYPGPMPAELEQPLAAPAITGKQLRAARERHGWTQRELARRLDVSYSRLCVWERGNAPIPAARLAVVHRVLQQS